MNKTDTEYENFSLHCVLDAQKDENKKSETLQEAPVEYSKCSEASGEGHPFVEWPEEYGNRFLIFSDEKTITVGYIFNKQNDQVVTFANDVSEHRRLSTTKQPTSIMMHDVERGDRRGCSLVWATLQANLFRLQRSFLDESLPMGQEDHWEIRLRLRIGRSSGTHGKDPRSPHWSPSTSVCGRTLRRQTRLINTDELKTSVYRSCQAIRKSFVLKVWMSFRPWLKHIIASTVGHILLVFVYRYVKNVV